MRTFKEGDRVRFYNLLQSNELKQVSQKEHIDFYSYRRKQMLRKEGTIMGGYTALNHSWYMMEVSFSSAVISFPVHESEIMCLKRAVDTVQDNALVKWLEN